MSKHYRTPEQSRALRQLIVEMSKDFSTQKEIAEKLRVSQRYVSRVLNVAGVKCAGAPYFRQVRARFDKDGYVILPELSEEEKAECKADVYGHLTQSIGACCHEVRRGR